MSSDVNSGLVQRGVKSFFRTVHMLFRNFEWASIVLLFCLPAHAFFTDFDYAILYQSAGYVLLLLGAGVRVWARGYEKNGQFVLDGPYRYVQNPDELGSLFMYLGAYAGVGVLWSWVVAAMGIFLLYFSLVSKSYEEKLKKRAGQNFPRYRQRVPRWIPSIYPLMNRSKTEFSWKKALKNEYVLWIWLLGLIAYKFYRTTALQP